MDAMADKKPPFKNKISINTHTLYMNTTDANSALCLWQEKVQSAENMKIAWCNKIHFTYNGTWLFIYLFITDSLQYITSK